MTQTIAPETSIGEICLVVSNLDRSIQFYRDSLGFQVIEQQPGQAVLGAGGNRLITLIEKPGARPPVRGTTGLYHFAILLPDRRSLAQLLYHMAEKNAEIQGASDHGVSEALYLADPDGNGIELYRDRKRAEWPVDDLGRLFMGTDELDVDDLVMELSGGLSPWKGLPEKTKIGHVHLQVRDLAVAEQFYTGVLGFQLMQRYGSGASFVSAGGYHHHIGMNTWTSANGAPPPADAVGLCWFEVRLPGADALETVRARLEAAGVAFEPQMAGILVRDPSQNSILFRA